MASQNYVMYEYDEGKFAKVPRKEIARYMETHEECKTEDDACWLWCEDNDLIYDEEVERLTEKAKKERITATIHQARAKEHTTRKVERKADETKDSLVDKLATYLTELGFTDVKVVKIGKLIEFDHKGEHFKLDLIRQRPPKDKDKGK